MKSCAEIIRGLREDRDLKQIEVAKIIGTSQQHYSNYETGAHELPLRAVCALADFYGVSADYIMGRRDCFYGVPGLDKKVDAEHTAGDVMTDILSLDASGRAYVLESIYLQKLKASCAKEKDGRRS